MSISTKVHWYPHTLRSVAMAGNNLCQDKAFFYVVPPREALTIENLYLHLKLTFDAAVPIGDRKLQYIGICDEIPLLITQDPNYFRKLDLNMAADPVTRKLELRLNLTSLLNKENAGWRDRFEEGTDLTYIIIKTVDNTRGISNVATIDLCKADALYTTQGIR